MGGVVVVAGGVGAAVAVADGAVVGSGAGATSVGAGVGVGAGFGAAWVGSVLCASGATFVEGSVFGESLAHPASAIDAAAVNATAMLPDVPMADRVQKGHEDSDA